MPDWIRKRAEKPWQKAGRALNVVHRAPQLLHNEGAQRDSFPNPEYTSCASHSRHDALFLSVYFWIIGFAQQVVNGAVKVVGNAGEIFN